MSNREIKMLQLLNCQEHIQFHDLSVRDSDALDLLLSRGYVQLDKGLVLGAVGFVVAYAITDAGRIALADFLVERRRRRWEDVRYVITTGIAVAALIVSLIRAA